MNSLTFEDIKNMYSDIIFVIGYDSICIVFFVDQRIKYIKESIFKIEQNIGGSYFVKIDYCTLVNTRYFIKSIKETKEIILRNGFILKVSRRKWRLFQ